MKRFKLILILSSLILSACGGGGSAGFKPGDGLTGKSKTVTDADTKKRVVSQYTISGFKAAFDALVKKVGHKNDTGLANALIDVQVTPLDAKNAKTEGAPQFLQVEFKFKASGTQIPASLKFKAKMNAEGKALNSITKQADKKFQLLAYCYTQSCRRIELRLQRTDDPNTPEIGLLVSKSRPTLKVIKPSSIKQFSDRGLRQLESLTSRGVVAQNSGVVVGGSSYSEITVKAHASAAPTLRILADLIDTENVVTDVTSVNLEGGSNARAKLVGNDSSTGDLMFEVISGAEATILLFEKDPSEIEAEEHIPHQQAARAGRDLSARAEPNTGLFPTSAANAIGLDLANDFASYGLHSRTQHFVSYYSNQDQKGVKNVFTYTHNVSPYISKVFESLKLTPEFAYLLPVESAYLKGNGTFNAQQVTGVKPSEKNKNPSAYGPWQIVNKTAFDIKDTSGQDFNLFFIRNKKANPEDDRGYLVQSTFMAATYIKKLVRLFPQDTGMAIMAYHAGEYGVCKEVADNCTPKNMVERLRHLSSRNVTLEQVEKYQMIEPIHRNYAFAFLAWREMGQNAARYGLQNIKKINTDAYKKRLSRPNGPTPLTNGLL